MSEIAISMFRRAAVVTIISRSKRIADAREPRVDARIKRFGRLGFPRRAGRPTGPTANFALEDLFKLRVAFDLADCGIAGGSAALMVEAHWPLLRANFVRSDDRRVAVFSGSFSSLHLDRTSSVSIVRLSDLGDQFDHGFAGSFATILDLQAIAEELEDTIRLISLMTAPRVASVTQAAFDHDEESRFDFGRQLSGWAEDCKLDDDGRSDFRISDDWTVE